MHCWRVLLLLRRVHVNGRGGDVSLGQVHRQPSTAAASVHCTGAMPLCQALVALDTHDAARRAGSCVMPPPFDGHHGRKRKLFSTELCVDHVSVHRFIFFPHLGWVAEPVAASPRLHARS
jgi:hypothetical protein